jgi:hypothetical protein
VERAITFAWPSKTFVPGKRAYFAFEVDLCGAPFWYSFRSCFWPAWP